MLSALLAAPALLALLAGCGDHSSAPTPEPAPSASGAPRYDGSLPPARAVMALVPADATSLAVTDFDEVKAGFGENELSSRDPVAERSAFWRRADRGAPMLTPGLLRPADAALTRRFGFGAADVAWEATFTRSDGNGWVIRLADGVRMAKVKQALDAGVGPLANARVDVADHLLMRAAAEPGQPNWAADPTLTALVDTTAAGTYVARGCLEGAPGTERLQPLHAYAVSLASTLATARLGADREDLFARMHRGRRLPVFNRVFTHPVADPASGRIGYRMADPAAAAEVVLRRQLPFAVCG